VIAALALPLVAQQAFAGHVAHQHAGKELKQAGDEGYEFQGATAFNRRSGTGK
jgi:hypothetical protein